MSVPNLKLISLFVPKL